MRAFFGYDGPLMTLLMRLWNCVWLTLLFLFCSLPVVTAGLSYSALYYTIRKTMRYERGYVTPTFFHALRANWRQGLPAGGIFLGIGVLLYLDFAILRGFLEAGSGVGHLSVLILIIALVLLLYALWVFAYLSRFQDALRDVFRNSALLAASHGGRSVLAFLILAAGALICYIEPILTALLPAICVWLISVLFEKTFREYMTEEQREADAQENREWKAEAEERRKRRREQRERRRGGGNPKRDL